MPPRSFLARRPEAREGGSPDKSAKKGGNDGNNLEKLMNEIPVDENIQKKLKNAWKEVEKWYEDKLPDDLKNLAPALPFVTLLLIILFTILVVCIVIKAIYQARIRI